MHSAAALDDFDSNAFLEVRVNSIVNACNLQRLLGVAINALHLCIKNRLQLPSHATTKNENLAISNGAYGNHWMQFAMDFGAVVHDGGKNRCGPHGRCVLVGISHETYGAKILLSF